MPRRTLLTLAVVTAVLAGCGEQEPEKDPGPRIASGVCVAQQTTDQGNIVPDFSTIVDCTERHTYEVFGQLDVPRQAITGTTRSQRAANRDDLALPRELTRDSNQRVAFEKFADRECLRSWQTITGYARVEPNGTKAADAEVLPAFLGVTLGYSVVPEKEWLEGRQEVLCHARFEEPETAQGGERDARPRSSPTSALLVSGALSPGFPAELRACRAYENDKRETILMRSCTDRHVAEVLFFFEADAVFGKGFVERIRKRPTPKKFDRFDQACADALPVLLGNDYDRKALRAFGSTARRWNGSSTPVRCDVGPTRFRNRDLAAGSVVGIGGQKVKTLRVD